jgi:hypothetical protein
VPDDTAARVPHAGQRPDPDDIREPILMLLVPLLVRLWKAFKARNRQTADGGRAESPAGR